MDTEERHLHIESIEKQVKYLEEAERELKTTMSKDEEKELKEEARNLQKPVQLHTRLFNVVSDLLSDKRLKREAYSLRAQKRRTKLLTSKDVKLVQSDFNRDEIRVVLNGKTGKGKSALGNNLLGYNQFTSKASLKGITMNCKYGVRYLDREHKLLVVDTPGLFDSEIPNKEMSKEITKCVALAAPGPNIFIFVVSAERFSPEEKETLTNLQKLFGETVIDHVIIVFTRKEILGDVGIVEFMKDADDILLDLLVKCKFRFAFINNRADPDDLRVDIDVILDLIFKTIGENNGAYYTNKEFGIIERALENMIKEKEEERVKELEHLKEQKRLVKHKEEKKTEPQKLKEEERKPRNELLEDAGFKKVEEEIHDVGATLREISIFLKQINIGNEESGIGNIEEKYENIQKLFYDQSRTDSESSNKEYKAMLISEISNLKQNVNDLMTFLRENKTRKSSGELSKELHSEFDKIEQRMDSMEDRMTMSQMKPRNEYPNDVGFKKLEEEIHDVGATFREISIFLKQINIGNDESGIGNIEEKYENIQKLFYDQSKTDSESPDNEYISMLISVVRNLKQIVNDLVAFLKENKTRKSSREFAKELKSEFDKIMRRMDSMKDKMSRYPTVNNTINVYPRIEAELREINRKIEETRNKNVYYEVKKEIEKDETTKTFTQKVMEAAGIGAGVATGAAVVAGAVAVAGAPLVAAGAGVVAVGAGVAKAASWIKSWW